jgi:hypothetical protein
VSATPEGADTRSSSIGPPVAGSGGVDDDHLYLQQVRREIDSEVRRRRASGELPPGLESELQELFARHAPLGGSHQELQEVLQLVDAAAFIDPLVPVESNRSGGAIVKRGIRSVNFWYLRFVTDQISQFASSVSRALHVLDEQITVLVDKVEAVDLPPSVVIDDPLSHRADAWWVATVRDELSGASRRVVHAACGDGWLVKEMTAAGLDAYGVEPRSGRVDEHGSGDLDLRGEAVLDHLRAVAVGTLDGVVLSGLVEGSFTTERRRLVDAAASALAPGGVLIVHSLSPSAWEVVGATPEADVAGTRPWRAGTWPHVVAAFGIEATVTTAPADERDYVVVCRRPAGGPTST